MFEPESMSIKYSDILSGPHQITFDITNKCNLRCLHCYNSSGENFVSENELSDEEVIEFIEDISKLHLYNFCFCGGEPLLRKDLMLKCAKILKENNTSHISMVTNGIFMTEETALQLKACGIQKIQVSLDGSDASTHDRLRNKEGCFDKAIAAIKILRKVGIMPNIAFTPTAFNIHQFKEVHTLLRNLGVISGDFRTQPLMLLGRANKNLESIKPTNMQYRTLVKEIDEMKKLDLKPIPQWGDPVDHLIRFGTGNWCVNFANIRANGDIVVSPYLPLVVGNIRKHSFNDYWASNLSRIWEYEIPKELARRIVSIDDMSKTYEDLPVVWKDKDIYIDLIDNDLNDLKLITK